MTEITITDPTAVPSKPKPRVSRLLVAGLVAAALLLGTAAFFEQDAARDRDEARRNREIATSQVHLQESSTETAEGAERRAQVTGNSRSDELANIADIAEPFVSLGDKQLEADRTVQAAGLNPDAIDAYNAAIDRSNAVVDQYNTALQTLVDQIKGLPDTFDA